MSPPALHADITSLAGQKSGGAVSRNQSAKRPTRSSPTRRTVSGVPVGMLKMKYWTPAAASSSTRATSSSGVPMSEVVGSSPGDLAQEVPGRLPSPPRRR